jgi:hypothetical protein
MKFMKIKIQLNKNNYCLTVKPQYCGATATNKKPRKNEDWLRGNDLKDGKLSKLPSVLWDIFCYEFGIGRWSGFRLAQ